MAEASKGLLKASDPVIRPVVLCGGSGSRLWPSSRSFHPKQLLAIESSQTMLQATVSRMTGENYEKPLVVTGEDYRFLVRDQLRAACVEPEAIILEPRGRNTAAAIALASCFEAAADPQRLMLVMPADHVVGDVEAFRKAVRAGIPAAQGGAIVTFGIRPKRPETGYGYIEAEAVGRDSPALRKIVRFVEKPDASTAELFFRSSNHFWNGGIFLFRAETLIRELGLHAPDVASACAEAISNATRDGEFVRPEPTAFLSSPSISIDYAVMEATDRGYVVPVDMRWSDIGSWDAVWEMSKRDASSNALSGDVVAVETSGCLIRSDSTATIATLGVSDLVVVATRDAVLIASRSRAQDMKTLINALEDAGVDKQALHPQVHRPWGSYEIVDGGEGFQTKRIIINPGQRLSLQMHRKRSEHWIVVSGTARVTVGDDVRLLGENESTFVPVGSPHRLENPGETPLHLVEIQCGSYLGEDDIVRFEDDYGRFASTA